jgi:hypothetical protein
MLPAFAARGGCNAVDSAQIDQAFWPYLFRLCQPEKADLLGPAGDFEAGLLVRGCKTKLVVVD